MDEFTLNHLEKWLDSARYTDEKEKIKSAILEFAETYPELLLDHSWPEIEFLAMRKL